MSPQKKTTDLLGSVVDSDKGSSFDLLNFDREFCVDWQFCPSFIPEPKLLDEWTQAPVDALCTANETEGQLRGCSEPSGYCLEKGQEDFRAFFG
jgi:hypothetical protein